MWAPEYRHASEEFFAEYATIFGEGDVYTQVGEAIDRILDCDSDTIGISPLEKAAARVRLACGDEVAIRNWVYRVRRV